jgi:hypothetical protein
MNRLKNDIRGFVITDEAERYVVGYVKDNNELRYIAYDKKDSCAIKVISNKETVLKIIDNLTKTSMLMGDNHIFKYREII